MAVSSDGNCRTQQLCVHCALGLSPSPPPARVQLLVQLDSLPTAQDPEGHPRRLICNTCSRRASVHHPDAPRLSTLLPVGTRAASCSLPSGCSAPHQQGRRAPLMAATLTGGRRQLLVVLMFVPLMLSDNGASS